MTKKFAAIKRRYRILTEKQAERFRKWARRHRPSFLLDWEAYHPICRDEWRMMGIGPTRPEVKEDTLAAPSKKENSQ